MWLSFVYLVATVTSAGQEEPLARPDQLPSSSEAIYPVCTSSVIWGDNYQILHNLIVKHRSIRAQHPKLPHFVLAAEDVPPNAIQVMKDEGMTIRMIKHVDYEAENRESGFAKIMTKLRALELTECEWVIQMDIDMVALRSITDAVAECDAGDYDLCGVPQTPSCSGRECCMPQGNGNILHVLVVNTGFMVYRPGSFLREKLFDTLKKTAAPREQTLWGQTICMHQDIKIHMLPRKFNIWTDLSWVPDIHVLHYGIGPAYLGGDMVPYTNSKFYEFHHGFEYYRRLSLGVDPCAKYLYEEECGKVPVLPMLEDDEDVNGFLASDTATPAPIEFRFMNDISQFYPKCAWKEKRCIGERFTTLTVEDKDVEMGEIVDGNAALHCAVKDNPIGAIRMINNCGTFCSYALHLEDYCDTNFSLFNCLGLIFSYMTDYRAYATLWVGMWISCLPKVWVMWLRVGGFLVFCGFCFLCCIMWTVCTRCVFYFASACTALQGMPAFRAAMGQTLTVAKTNLPRWQAALESMGSPEAVVRQKHKVSKSPPHDKTGSASRWARPANLLLTTLTSKAPVAKGKTSGRPGNARLPNYPSPVPQASSDEEAPLVQRTRNSMASRVTKVGVSTLSATAKKPTHGRKLSGGSHHSRVPSGQRIVNDIQNELARATAEMSQRIGKRFSGKNY